MTNFFYKWFFVNLFLSLVVYYTVYTFFIFLNFLLRKLCRWSGRIRKFPRCVGLFKARERRTDRPAELSILYAGQQQQQQQQQKIINK